MTRRNELLNALETTPHDLVRTLKGIDPTLKTLRSTSETWSISDVLNHLSSVEICYLNRLQRVAIDNNPTIPFIHPDPENHDLSVSFDDLIARFITCRTETLAYLRLLSAGIWARHAFFEDGQKTSFRYLVQMLVDHDTEHLNQIIEIKYSTSPS